MQSNSHCHIQIHICEVSLGTIYPPPPAHHNTGGVEAFELIWFQSSKSTGAQGSTISGDKGHLQGQLSTDGFEPISGQYR